MVLILPAILYGCTTTQRSAESTNGSGPGGVDQPFTVPGFIAPSPPVYSARLHPVGRPGAAPILELNRQDQLHLQFETIGPESHSYRVTFTHHNPDWTPSGLTPDRFMDGFYTQIITGGTLNSRTRPYYRSYEFKFPGEGFAFLVSGNYMLHVEDSDTGEVIFNHPFYLVENEGQITSFVEVIQTPRQDLRVTHRPVSHYRLPDFVDQPQFDLTFLYTQNRFWGRGVRPREIDFSDPEEVRFETSEKQSFTGDYEFRVLNLNDLSGLNSTILDIDPASEPRKVVLRDDAEGFTDPVSVGTPRPSGPNSSPHARYLDVQFRFDTGMPVDSGKSLYLAGDFNDWQIRPEQRMDYNPNTGRWETSAVMKEGIYRYKYLLIEQETINDLTFDTLFTDSEQEYHAFVYLREPNEFYYRLLQYNRFYRGSR